MLYNIFEPFIREIGKDKTIEGIGLGLSITRRLVELMQGKITVESEIGKGSTFTVELGMEVVETGSVVEVEKSKRKVIGYNYRESGRTKDNPKRLLIVDDNVTNLSMLVSTLESFGFEINIAENGRHAIEKVSDKMPDLILMDYLMPIMNGHEALNEIRGNKKLQSIKIIGVSAAVADKERVDKFAADCDGFISKPVDIDLLLDMLKEILNIEWIVQEVEESIIAEVKYPPEKTLREMLKAVEMGDYKRLGKIIEIFSDDNSYMEFCNKISNYMKAYDEDNIVELVKGGLKK